MIYFYRTFDTLLLLLSVLHLVTVVLPLALHLHSLHVAGQAVQDLLLVDEGHHSLCADDLAPDHSENLSDDGLQCDAGVSIHAQVLVTQWFVSLDWLYLLRFHSTLCARSVLYELGFKYL